ncbi:unnamed protein product [Brassica oleracea]
MKLRLPRFLKVDDTSGLPCVFYLQSGASLSHRKKYPNSLSTEDEDPAPALGSSSTVGYLLLDLLSFDPPLEILVFSALAPKLLFFLVPPPEVFLLCMHGRHLSSSPRRYETHSSKGRYETELKAFVLEQPAASRCVLMHSFGIHPAGWPVRDCALWRDGIGPTFWRPQSART